MTMFAFTSAIDALFADPNIGEDALWKAGGVGAGVAVRIICKSPDRMAVFGESRTVLPTIGIDIRRSRAATINEGGLIVVGGDAFTVTGETIAVGSDEKEIGGFVSKGIANPTERMITVAVNKSAQVGDEKLWKRK